MELSPALSMQAGKLVGVNHSLGNTANWNQVLLLAARFLQVKILLSFRVDVIVSPSSKIQAEYLLCL